MPAGFTYTIHLTEISLKSYFHKRHLIRLFRINIIIESVTDYYEYPPTAVATALTATGMELILFLL